MDLTEVEGLADLINAETEMQRRQALNQMEGILSNLYSEWRNDIIKALANVEAYIDFHEEENIEDDVLEQVNRKLSKLRSSIQEHLNDNRRGERLRNGIRVVIIGEPNAGKSSLLNNICQRPAAIVSPIPGTTRDIIESSVNIGGYPVLLSDTAGLRETDDLIEKEGVKRANERIETADILVLVIDSFKYCKKIQDNNQIKEFLTNHMKSLMIENQKISDFIKDKKLIVVFNKIDLVKEKFCLDNNEEFSVCSMCSLEKDQSIVGLMDIINDKLKSL